MAAGLALLWVVHSRHINFLHAHLNQPWLLFLLFCNPNV